MNLGLTMLRIAKSAIQFFASLAVACWAVAGVLDEMETAGTYRWNGKPIHGLVPTNYSVFSLTLAADGSFVATNLPAGIFFWTEDPTPSARGRWHLKRVQERPSFFFTGEADYLFLDFETPSRGGFSVEIEGHSKTRRFRIDHRSGKEPKFDFGFYLERIP